jgi:hypothetical protein
MPPLRLLRRLGDCGIFLGGGCVGMASRLPSLLDGVYDVGRQDASPTIVAVFG